MNFNVISQPWVHTSAIIKKTFKIGAYLECRKKVVEKVEFFLITQ